jgi:hypothetical protein
VTAEGTPGSYTGDPDINQARRRKSRDVADHKNVQHAFFKRGCIIFVRKQYGRRIISGGKMSSEANLPGTKAADY